MHSSRVPVVYIAGPFRAANAWLREKNIREAEELAFRIAACGAMPLCPHTNTRFFDGTLTDDFWLAGTLELLGRCDAIALTERWIQSTGACTEHAWAVAHDLKIFTANESGFIYALVEQWVKQWKEEVAA